jgi:restriction system protein
MKLKLHENSLFAVLMRSPWWISAAIAGGLFALMRVWLPVEFAVFGALPFAVIGAVAAWKQLSTPSAAQVATRMEKIRNLSAEEFNTALEAGFRKEGYGVARVKGVADFELSKGGRVTLVASKRWKAATTGVAPLEALDKARRAQNADECAFVTAGAVSEQASAYAVKQSIRIIDGAALANLLT